MAGTKKICSRCILDTTVPEIKFDENGVCNYCKLHDRLEEKYPLNEEGQRKLNGLVEEIKSDGKGKKYDCIVGVSGGTDSTYTLYVVKKMGLRPLAVHLDNGWNSEIAVRNIKNAVAKLGVDLHTIVLDWEEFKDIQLSFLKASVPDAEIPTDIAILGALFKAAADEKIRYVINGHSFRTEGNSPIGWSYMDGRYVKSVQKIFGSKKLKTFTNVTIFDLLYYLILKRVRFVSLPEYLIYKKEDVQRTLKDEVGWEYYGGKHCESTYTRFFQTYILPTKFNIDKRKVHYSALIRSGQMTRSEALEKIKTPQITEEEAEEQKEYVSKKLGVTVEEFEELMSHPPKTFRDYPTYLSIIRMFRVPIKVACKIGLLPDVLYEKYAR